MMYGPWTRTIPARRLASSAIAILLLVAGCSGEEFGKADARRIEAAFNARDARALAEALDTVPDDSLAALAREAVPEGSELRIDADSFEVVGEALAVVTAEVAGERSLPFSILLRRVQGRWMVISTSPPDR